MIRALRLLAPFLPLAALADTCQSIAGAGFGALTETRSASYGRLIRDRSSEHLTIYALGVECQMDVAFYAPGSNGTADFFPAPEQVEGFEHRLNQFTGPVLLERELTISHIDIGNSKMSVYKQVYMKTGGEYARAPELEVRLEPRGSGNRSVRVLWRTFSYGQSQTWQGAVTVLHEVTLPACTPSFMSCPQVAIHTKWWELPNQLARLIITVKVDGIAVLPAIPTIGFGSNYSDPPKMTIGHIDSTRGSDFDGWVSLQHSYCAHLLNAQTGNIERVGSLCTGQY